MVAKKDQKRQNRPKLKVLTKKFRFFSTFFFSNAVYIGAEEAFKKIIGSIRQKWMIIENNERATL